MIARERDRAPHVLVLDSGDALTGGGSVGDRTKGEAIVAGMNLMAYDAMAIGPKDLSVGRDVFAERLRQASFPFLSINVTDAQTGRPVAEGYVVIERGGHRFAVIGVTRDTDSIDPAGFVIADALQALAEIVPRARREAETIIVLTNLDLEAAEKAMAPVPDVDLVVAGNPLYLPDHALRDEAGDTLTVTAEQPQPRHTGRRVGRLHVTVDGSGRLRDEVWSTAALAPDIADDREMARLLGTFALPGTAVP